MPKIDPDMRQPVSVTKVHEQLERHKNDPMKLIAFLEQVENEPDATLGMGARNIRLSLLDDPNNVDVTRAYRFLWRHAEAVAKVGGFTQ